MSKKLFKRLVVIVLFIFFITNLQTVIDAIIIYNLDITSGNFFLAMFNIFYRNMFFLNTL